LLRNYAKNQQKKLICLIVFEILEGISRLAARLLVEGYSIGAVEVKYSKPAFSTGTQRYQKSLEYC
jgi:hypothetical protein